MSVETAPSAETPTDRPSEILDLTGLPAPVIAGLRTIVASLRDQHPGSPPPAEPARPGETPEEWTTRLNAWIETQGVRVGGARDDRESIYDCRGE